MVCCLTKLDLGVMPLSGESLGQEDNLPGSPARSRKEQPNI